MVSPEMDGTGTAMGTSRRSTQLVKADTTLLNQQTAGAPPLRKTSDELFRGLQAADETAIGGGELLQKSR